MNERLWDDNEFISFFYQYYIDANASFEFLSERYLLTKKVKVPRFNHFKFITKEVSENYDGTKELLDKRVNKFIDDQFKDPNYNLSFIQLWNFCKFVRYAEKTVFWKNIPDNFIYVDSDLYDDKCIKFSLKDRLQDPLIECMFELEKVKVIKKSIVSEDDNYLEVIKLTITRQFGKTMTNVFHIVDADVKYNDSSDILLITTINRLLR